MKHLIVILLIVFSFQAKGQSKWIAPDKAHHVVYSFTLNVVSTELSKVMKIKHPELVGFGVSMSAGIIKELTDTKFDGKDLVADLVGNGLGYLFSRVTNKKSKGINVKISYARPEPFGRGIK